MDTFVAAALAHLVQIFGSLGAAILALSLGVRIALLPLTLTLARRGLRRQAIMHKLQPEIEALQKRFEKKPERLFSEMRELYRKHDCSPFDLPTLLGSFAQLPIFGILYSAISASLKASTGFLWIRNLAAPDIVLSFVILLLTGLSSYFAPGLAEQTRVTLTIIQLLVTAVIVWKLAAGLGLYWAASSFVGLIQTVWLRYRNPSFPKLA